MQCKYCDEKYGVLIKAVYIDENDENLEYEHFYICPACLIKSAVDYNDEMESAYRENRRLRLEATKV